MKYHFEDGTKKSLLNDFSEVIFDKQEESNDTIKVVFEDYIIKPFNGFDFHDKWNNGVPPYAKQMYGNITKETNGMYFFEVHSQTDIRLWRGWCPKKSCFIFNI